MRICTTCQKSKEANTDNFYKHTYGKFGLNSVCIGCHLQRKITLYEDNLKEYKLANVLELKEGDMYVCNLCQYKTSDESNMEKHLNTKKHHKNVNSK